MWYENSSVSYQEATSELLFHTDQLWCCNSGLRFKGEEQAPGTDDAWTNSSPACVPSVLDPSVLRAKANENNKK